MTLHILPNLEQRSPEWFEQRRGIVTASAVGRLITPTLKVADNDVSRGVTATLATERITGWTEETPVSSDMWRGIEMEPYARDEYAYHHAPVETVGFMRLEGDAWTLGYSPDGLVGEDGLLEIKCPRAKTHVRTILDDEVPAHYIAQLQAGLFVSGRAWIDFVSYVTGLPLYVKRVTPNEDWFDAIRNACIAFESSAARIVADYEARVTGLPMTEHVDPNKVELKLA